MKKNLMHVDVDWGNPKSIRKAETKKQRLENQGYKLMGTKQVRFDKFRLTYKKGR